MRVLCITNLFPHAANPGYAPFNRQQFEALSELVELHVYRAQPWGPGRGGGRRRGQENNPGGARITSVSAQTTRFLSIPGLPGLNAASLASAAGRRLALEALAGRGYDVILGAYAYPDGCAAVALGQLLRLPVVVKCHGSDLNRVPSQRLPRLQLKALLPRAERVVAVSAGLAEVAAGLGVPADRLRVVYNGVDRDRFFPQDPAAARAKLGLDPSRPLGLFVGHLAAHKGVGELLAAAELLAKTLPEARLHVIGDGPMAAEVRAAEARLPVRLLGRKDHAELADHLAAADLLCLPSWGEGMPNVVREAHAAGRPVVATRVGGIPEAVHHPALGQLVPPRAPAPLAEALATQLRARHDRDPDQITRLAQVPSWPESAAQLQDVLREAISDA